MEAIFLIFNVISFIFQLLMLVRDVVEHCGWPLPASPASPDPSRCDKDFDNGFSPVLMVGACCRGRRSVW